MNKDICPICDRDLERGYGLLGIVAFCSHCEKQWVKCLGKWITREEFHQTKEAWK